MGMVCVRLCSSLTPDPSKDLNQPIGVIFTTVFSYLVDLANNHVAVSARPERLPGGLGILSIERPLEPTDEFHQTRLEDTLNAVLRE